MDYAHSYRLSISAMVIMVLTMSCGKDDNPSGAQGNIVFDTNRDPEDSQGAEIYVTKEDGTQQTRLTNSPGFDTDPRWNSNGTKIIFASHRDVGPSNVYVMNADGSNPIRLTDPIFGGSLPVFSPDNSVIAYNSSDGLSSSNAGIYLMDADGSNRRRLGTATGDSNPDFSPDGNKIVFHSSRTGNEEIFVMDVDGTNQIRLTNDPATDFMPSWNPNGNQIVFVSFRNNEKGIYLMNADGSNQNSILISPGSEQPNDPAFSHDGNKIVFSTVNRLHIMDADGTDLITLPGASYNGNPDWK